MKQSIIQYLLPELRDLVTNPHEFVLHLPKHAEILDITKNGKYYTLSVLAELNTLRAMEPVSFVLATANVYLLENFDYHYIGNYPESEEFGIRWFLFEKIDWELHHNKFKEDFDAAQIVEDQTSE